MPTVFRIRLKKLQKSLFFFLEESAGNFCAQFKVKKSLHFFANNFFVGSFYTFSADLRSASILRFLTPISKCSEIYIFAVKLAPFATLKPNASVVEPEPEPEP
jgi:hypothetical protein